MKKKLRASLGISESDPNKDFFKFITMQNDKKNLYAQCGPLFKNQSYDNEFIATFPSNTENKTQICSKKSTCLTGTESWLDGHLIEGLPYCTNNGIKYWSADTSKDAFNTAKRYTFTTKDLKKCNPTENINNILKETSGIVSLTPQTPDYSTTDFNIDCSKLLVGIDYNDGSTSNKQWNSLRNPKTWKNADFSKFKKENKFLSATAPFTAIPDKSVPEGYICPGNPNGFPADMVRSPRKGGQISQRKCDGINDLSILVNHDGKKCMYGVDYNGNCNTKPP